MTAKEEILRRLRGKDGYVSGGELSALLGVTRAAVWKDITQLRSEGYEIDSVTNRGYRLVSCPDRFLPEEIRDGLENCIFGQNVVCMESVDSTNEEAKRCALKGAPGGSVFVSERQTGGKGRLGRTWSSPPGTGLWFSVLLRPGQIPLCVSATTLLAGYAVSEGIRTVTGLKAGIKWPNDVVIGSKKVCGILTEMSAEMERMNYVIIGIGVNVNNESFPEELREKATSLFLETGKTVRRATLLRAILQRLELSLSSGTLGMSDSFLEAYRERCVSLGRQVSFQRGGRTVTGEAEDISREGELLVRTADGSLEKVLSGEVLVQGIYGQKL